MKEFVFTHSVIGTYQSCPRKALFSHYYNLTRKLTKPSKAFFGNCLHDGMAAMINKAKETYEVNDILQAGIDGFNQRWGSKFPVALDYTTASSWAPVNPGVGYDILEAWLSTSGDMLTRAKTQNVEDVILVNFVEEDFIFGGTVDWAYIHDELTIVDHKSTGQYGKDTGFKPTWLQSHMQGAQFNGYAFIYYLKTGLVPKVMVNALLVNKTHRANSFHHIPMSLDGIKDWLIDMKQWVKAFRADIDALPTGKPCFPRCKTSCFDYNMPCSYMNICNAYPVDIPDVATLKVQFPEYEMNDDYSKAYYDVLEQKPATQYIAVESLQKLIEELS